MNQERRASLQNLVQLRAPYARRTDVNMTKRLRALPTDRACRDERQVVRERKRGQQLAVVLVGNPGVRPVLDPTIAGSNLDRRYRREVGYPADPLAFASNVVSKTRPTPS